MNPTQVHPSNNSPTLWNWAGWRGLAVAVAVMMVGIPVVLWYGSEESSRSTPSDPPPLPLHAGPQIWRGPTGPQWVYPPHLPPIPIHALELEAAESESEIMRIRLTENGHRIAIQRNTGKVLAIHDNDGKELFALAEK